MKRGSEAGPHSTAPQTPKMTKRLPAWMALIPACWGILASSRVQATEADQAIVEALELLRAPSVENAKFVATRLEEIDQTLPEAKLAALIAQQLQEVCRAHDELGAANRNAAQAEISASRKLVYAEQAEQVSPRTGRAYPEVAERNRREAETLLAGVRSAQTNAQKELKAALQCADDLAQQLEGQTATRFQEILISVSKANALDWEPRKRTPAAAAPPKDPLQPAGISIVTLDGRTYNRVTVKSASADGIAILHSSGACVVPVSNLSDATLQTLGVQRKLPESPAPPELPSPAPGPMQPDQPATHTAPMATEPPPQNEILAPEAARAFPAFLFLPQKKSP